MIWEKVYAKRQSNLVPMSIHGRELVPLISISILKMREAVIHVGIVSN